MFKFFEKEQPKTEQPKNAEKEFLAKQKSIVEDSKKKRQLTLEDRLKLADLGIEAIERREFRFAGICFKEAGFEEDAKPLFELARFLKEKEAASPQKQKKELSPMMKMQLKELGLTFASKNQNHAAGSCFRGAGLSVEEIKSLSGMNLLEIDKEKERLEEEIRKMQAEQKEHGN